MNNASSPPPYITCFASKYLNGVRYFSQSIFPLISIAIDRMNVINRMAVEIETARFGYRLTAAIASPIPKNNNWSKNIPIISSKMS
ncbi:hypothetical protein D3C84_1201740 [compost metagenome]